MNSLTVFVKGECMSMCPEEEINLRAKERLLHVLELIPNPVNSNKPKLDRCRVVKSFCRSAAGRTMQKPKHLRPTSVLLKTVRYLLQDVITNTRVSWNVTYDFITDRLRSVRQDMVIQNLPFVDCIHILQPIVSFYAYASYRSCNEVITNFDAVLNRRHFQECIKRLLCLYDECEHLNVSDKGCEGIEEARPHFEALYIVLNLGNIEALTRAITLAKNFRTNVVKLAITTSLAFYENNYVKVCKSMRELPHLLLAVASLHLSEIRRQALRVMSVAYNSKNLVFPLDILQKLFLYDNLDDVISDCTCYGLTCSKNGVHFVKTDFKENAISIQPAHLSIVNEKLKATDISKLLLKPW